jgi:alkylation response protein AidB-like acyl-CoA dehydrogenase
MDFSLSDHQKLIRDAVRQFMEKEARLGVRQRDREGRFPAAEIKKLAAVTFDQVGSSGIGLSGTAGRKVVS